jgi:hypothetical protein
MLKRPCQVEQRNRAPTLVLIRAADAAAAAALERQQSEQQVAAVHEAAGFAAVFDLMRKSGKPAGACFCARSYACALAFTASGEDTLLQTQACTITQTLTRSRARTCTDAILHTQLHTLGWSARQSHLHPA